MKTRSVPIRTAAFALAAVFVVSTLATRPSAQAPVTTPEKFFGFQLGADRKIARWDKIVDYFNLLERRQRPPEGGEHGADHDGQPVPGGRSSRRRRTWRSSNTCGR